MKYVNLIFLIVIVALSSVSLIAQSYTYSSIPQIGSYVSCPSSNVNLTCGTEGVVKMKVASIDENNIVFVARKCDGGAFQKDGQFGVSWASEATAYLCERTSINYYAGDYTASVTVPTSFMANGNSEDWLGSIMSIDGSVFYAGYIIVEREEVLECEEPSNLHVDNLTSTSAKLDWNTVTNASAYIVGWRSSGGLWETCITNYSYKNISGLVPDTDYEFKVRTNCNNGEISNYVYSNFHTLPGQQYGSISVSIYPSGAVNASAKWKLDNGSWNNSGATVSNISIGTHTVSYKEINCWSQPS